MIEGLQRVLSGLALSWVAACAGPSADRGAEATYPDPERFRAEVDAFAEEAAPPPGGIVAVGSSSMRMWHPRIADDLAPLTIVPRGFGGSDMYDLRYFVTELVLRHKPRAVLIYEGDNDVALGAHPAQVLEHFDAIVADIHACLPAARIYMPAVKPSPSRWELWPAMARTNELLQARCERDASLTFVDIATPMLAADGRPPEEIFVGDRLHMNDAGYDIWRDTVRPVLIEGELRHDGRARDGAVPADDRQRRS